MKDLTNVSKIKLFEVFKSEYYGENFNSLTDCDRRYYGAGAVGKVKTYFFGNKAKINFKDVS